LVIHVARARRSISAGQVVGHGGRGYRGGAIMLFDLFRSSSTPNLVRIMSVRYVFGALHLRSASVTPRLGAWTSEGHRGLFGSCPDLVTRSTKSALTTNIYCSLLRYPRMTGVDLSISYHISAHVQNATCDASCCIV
jgi:hypothetical protein